MAVRLLVLVFSFYALLVSSRGIFGPKSLTRICQEYVKEISKPENQLKSSKPILKFLVCKRLYFPKNIGGDREKSNAARCFNHVRVFVDSRGITSPKQCKALGKEFRTVDHSLNYEGVCDMLKETKTVFLKQWTSRTETQWAVRTDKQWDLQKRKDAPRLSNEHIEREMKTQELCLEFPDKLLYIDEINLRIQDPLIVKRKRAELAEMCEKTFHNEHVEECDNSAA